MHPVEVRTIAKRLVPFLIVCYFIAYLDRVNVGFAALTMNQDLGLSQTAFGFGAGIFFLIRMLGAAEAGFFPGIIFYLTLWFPAEYRARIVGYFMAAIPLSTVIGAPISGALLYLHGGLGLAGWQWLFIVEALPSIILAGVVFFYLTDRPADAAWLAPDERIWLAERLELEQRSRKAVYDYTVLESLVNRGCSGSAWCISARWRQITG